jgi:hypothetical protein
MEFKHGAFSIAKESNTQILPIYVHGCQEGHGLNWVCGPTDLTLVYGNPFNVEEDKVAEDKLAPVARYQLSRNCAKKWMETEMKKLQVVSDSKSS